MPLNPLPLRKENRELLADSRPPSLLAEDVDDDTAAEDEDDASPLLFWWMLAGERSLRERSSQSNANGTITS